MIVRNKDWMSGDYCRQSKNENVSTVLLYETDLTTRKAECYVCSTSPPP